jgi:cellulose synthase/poly-beta-1,6-N-acetylglucosamine synthase-like glycosyltransferase
MPFAWTSLILVALAAAYAGFLLRFAVGLQRVLRQRGDDAHARHDPLAPEHPFVSVIVPARDEEDTIEACLHSILANDYPADRFEVIVVDDLSRDATAARVRSLQARLAHAHPVTTVEAPPDDAPHGPAVHLLQMPRDLERRRAHKKRAITRGIEHARGTIILTTDADCEVPPRWIGTMAARFDGETALVSGPVLYPDAGSLSRRAQALEFLGLVAVGAGAIGAGSPNLCNGANVAYRKSVFDALGGFAGIDHLTSGDDELLMQKIAYSTDWRVRFCASGDAAVVTEGAPSLRAFFEQRRRWASKGGHYPHPPLKAMVVTIYLFYLALLASAIALPFGAASGGALATAVALKAGAEAALLAPASRHFGRQRLMALFLPLQPLHVLYVVAMGAAGALGGYTWKGRKIER